MHTTAQGALRLHALRPESCHVTALSNLLADAKGDRSVDALIEQAEKAGHSVDRGTVYRALKGEHAKRPREETLASLAAVFGLDIRKVREAAARPSGERVPWTPPKEADQLDRNQRRAVEQMIKALIAETEQEQVLFRAVRTRNLIIADLLAGGDGTAGSEHDESAVRRARGEVASILARRRKAGDRDVSPAATKQGDYELVADPDDFIQEEQEADPHP